MNYVLKSFFATLLLTMVLTCTYSQENIELRIDDATGNLSLSPSDTIKLGSILNRKVSWEIKDTRIKSFIIVPKFDPNNPHPYIPDPFTERPSKPHGNKLELKVNFSLFRSGYWKYSITWQDSATQKHTLDPIISIKPTESFSTFLIILVIGIVSLPLLLLGKNRIRKKRNIN